MSKLIVALVDQVTAPSRGISAAIQKLTAASQANAVRLDAMRGKMMDAVGAGFALYKGLSAPINAAMDFEGAMADVRKVVDFDTPVAFQKMRLDIRALSREMPMAADGIAAIVAAAGQSGLSNDELLPFAQMAAKVGVAWDTSAAETGDALAKLKTALGLTISETGSLADAINHLGNKSAASAPDILDVVKRVGPMARQFGLTAEQAAAFGAAMVGSGFQSEVASTSFLNMGKALTKGVSATKRQKAAFATLKLSATAVAKGMQKNALGTIQTVLKRLRSIPDYMRASLISDLFGDEARALGPLITNSTLLADTIGLVANKMDYAGSAQAEYNERAKTSSNSMQLFKNRVNDLAISIGDALLPSLNSLIGTFGPIVTSLSELAQRYPRVTNAVVGLTAALVAFRVASTAAAFSSLFLKGAVINVAAASLAAGRSISLIAFGPAIFGFRALAKAVGFGAVSAKKTAVAGVAQAASLLSQRQAAYQSALSMQALAREGKIAGINLAQATANVKGAGAALIQAQIGMRSANASLAATASSANIVSRAFRVMKIALISTGVGAIAVGIAAAGTWIYNNWSGVTVAFEAFKGAFIKAIAPVMPAIKPVIDGVSWLSNKVSSLLGPIDEMGGKWARAGIAAGKFVGETLRYIIELPAKIISTAGYFAAAGMSLIQSLWGGMMQKFNELIEWAKGIPGRIAAAIGDINLSSIIKIPSWFGGGSGDSIQAPAAANNAGVAIPTFNLDGARAVGGPVKSGGSYLVGERGPEIVTFPRSGFVNSNMDTIGTLKSLTTSSNGGAASSPSPRSISVTNHITINAPLSATAQTVADAVARAIAEKVSVVANGAFSDGGM
ncbi:phage tail tape measure protein [Brucella sp. 10RB9213]|uniref:phage tail tape measure protein n=1 Tax=Brucella sp. 10RB9213 TaxID=1844039 RepID=UPI0018A0994D|nr:phage tail tape measure protein [Brucella sp. 10RB9213]